MKRNLILLALLLLATLMITASTYAQTFIAETYMERTSVSPKIGSAIGYQFLGKFEIGGFIQRSTELLVAEEGKPLRYENSFYGAFFTYPILSQSKKIDLNMRVRTGVTNEQNFTITPSIIAAYTPFKLLTFGTGIGMRSFRPTLMASIRINLFGKKISQSVVASLENEKSALSK